MAYVTRRITVTAGLFVRRRVIEEITSAAWRADLDCTHERVGGTIRFTLKGNEADIERLLKATSAWIADYNDAA